MRRFAFCLASTILSAGVAGVFASGVDQVENALSMSARELGASASASASGSPSVTIDSPGGLLILGVLAASAPFLVFFGLLAAAFVILAPLLIILTAIFAAIAAILLILTGMAPAPFEMGSAFEKGSPPVKRNLKSGIHAELAEGVSESIDVISDMIMDLVAARSDPIIGTGIDEQICELADVLSELEDLMGGKSGKRRALKGKSAKSGLSFCSSKSGKSGKMATYSPSPSSTSVVMSKSKSEIVMKSAKSKSVEVYPVDKSSKGKSATVSVVGPKSAKSSKAVSVVAPKSAKSSKAVEEGSALGQKSAKSLKI